MPGTVGGVLTIAAEKRPSGDLSAAVSICDSRRDETMKRSPSSAPFVRLSCRIEADDIAAMHDAYNSGMCDISTANCLARAIARELSGDRRVRLLRHGKSRAEVEVWGQRIPLSEELLQWLGTAEQGGPVDPVDFVLHIGGPHRPAEDDGSGRSHAVLVR